MWIDSHRELDVYKRGFDLAMEIFELSKGFPRDEKFSITDQVRRSSRSVCANLAEAWAKRRYEAHFISKMTDCIGEAYETQTWLDFAFACGYIDHGQFAAKLEAYHKLIHSLNSMIHHSSEWCKKKS